VKRYSPDDADKCKTLVSGDRVRAIIQGDNVEVIRRDGPAWVVVKSYNSMSNNYAYTDAREYAQQLKKQLAGATPPKCRRQPRTVAAKPANRRWRGPGPRM
jgi:hypothetical protein